jgi:L-lysine exporter family protein LysE/ArgO
MFSAFFTGFFLGFSLIIAIGAQNAFVLRQGIIQQHVLYVALFCSISDSLLIGLGVVGISVFFSDFINQYSNIIFGVSALWLFIYGLFKLKSAITGKSIIELKISKSKNVFSTISIVAILTFANPHVYLDTMVLIGTISQQFNGPFKLSFSIGACIASFIWFFALGYGAKIITPFMQKTFSWRILDSLIAIIFFTIAIKLAYLGSLL